MARRSPLQSALSQIRDVQTPTWWTLGQVLFGAIFAVFFLYSLLGHDTPPATTSPVAGPAGRTAPANPPSNVPASSPAGTVTPTGTPPASTGGTVLVPNALSSPVEVPADAVTLAKLGFAAYYDTATADQLPVVADGAFHSPYPPSASASSSRLRVSSAAPDRITFLALCDADGQGGPQNGTWLPITVVHETNTWKVIDPRLAR